MPDYTIGVVEDAIRVLDTFVDGKDRFTLAEITKESGLGKNKVFRILSTLQKHRFINRNEAGAYSLGLRFLEFGARVQSQLNSSWTSTRISFPADNFSGSYWLEPLCSSPSSWSPTSRCQCWTCPFGPEF